MKLSHEVIANVCHRLEQKAADIDSDPDIAAVTVTVYIARNRRVKGSRVELAAAFDAAPAGVLLRDGLTTVERRA